MCYARAMPNHSHWLVLGVHKSDACMLQQSLASAPAKLYASGMLHFAHAVLMLCLMPGHIMFNAACLLSSICAYALFMLCVEHLLWLVLGLRGCTHAMVKAQPVFQHLEHCCT